MSKSAEDQAEQWEPFGISEADFEVTPERDGVRVVNVTPGSDQGMDRARHWLRVAMIALGALASAAAAVSWQAQYNMVLDIKHRTWVAALEAGIPDAGAIVFATLGIALALHGKRAVRTRALNVLCVGISLMQNALAAGTGWRDLMIWVMPSAVYAVASDTLIGVIRAWAMARVRNLGEALADDGLTPLGVAGGAVLWMLRLTLAPKSTLSGFRSWVITDCPVAPGLRPGHVAQLEAVKQEAGQLAALVTAERDKAIEQAAEEVSQAREESARAEAAEAAMRDELKNVRSDAAQERKELQDRIQQQAEELRAEFRQIRNTADQNAAQILADAAKEREELRAQMAQETERLRAQLSQAYDEASDIRIAALQEAQGELLNVSGQLASALKTTARLQENGQRPRRPRVSRGDEPTKRDRMIELAGRQQDLATIPLQDVAKLASSVASEIDYSQGTARRELMRHVRQIQAITASPAEDGGESEAQ
ncbi:MAG TPA: hypothetical protein VF070_19685 [Streptosporangiaceae bacterium]